MSPLHQWKCLHKYCLYTGNYQTKNLAKYLGVTARTVERWITGLSRCADYYQYRIMEYLQTVEPADKKILDEAVGSCS